MGEVRNIGRNAIHFILFVTDGTYCDETVFSLKFFLMGSNPSRFKTVFYKEIHFQFSKFFAEKIFLLKCSQYA